MNSPPSDPLTADDWTCLNNTLVFYGQVAQPLALAARVAEPRVAAQAEVAGRYVAGRIRQIRALLRDPSVAELEASGAVPAGLNHQIFPLKRNFLGVAAAPADRSPEATAAWARDVLRTTVQALSTADDWAEGFSARGMLSDRSRAFLRRSLRDLPQQIVDACATLGQEPPPLSNTSRRTGVRTYPAASPVLAHRAPAVEPARIRPRSAAAHRTR